MEEFVDLGRALENVEEYLHRRAEIYAAGGPEAEELARLETELRARVGELAAFLGTTPEDLVSFLVGRA